MIQTTHGDGSRLLSGISWDEKNHAAITTDVIQLLTAAALVESRGEAYGEYLERVFFDDPGFIRTIKNWASEENEHGIALGTWISRSVPNIDFESLLRQYNEGIQLSYVHSEERSSIRGSKIGELLSRCAVESATSTYYKSIMDSINNEPLRTICGRLAKDEINHFSVFKKKLDELRGRDAVGIVKLLRLSLSRLFELEDDQMAYAFYVARNKGEPYDAAYYSALMARTGFAFYNKDRLTELVRLNLRAFGFHRTNSRFPYAHTLFVRSISWLLYRYIRFRLFYLNFKINVRRFRVYSKGAQDRHGEQNA